MEFNLARQIINYFYSVNIFVFLIFYFCLIEFVSYAKIFLIEFLKCFTHNHVN